MPDLMHNAMIRAMAWNECPWATCQTPGEIDEQSASPWLSPGAKKKLSPIERKKENSRNTGDFRLFGGEPAFVEDAG